MSILPRCFVLFCLAGMTVFGAAPSSDITRTQLFASGDNGYASYRIPALVVTPQRTVLAAVEGRRADRKDWGQIDLLLRRSLDGGLTWKPTAPLVTQDDLPQGITHNPVTLTEGERVGGFTISNATWIADHERARTLFLFCVEYQRSFVIESTDGGATFSKPREITPVFETFRGRDGYDWRVIATGPGHGVQLASGRLVVPVWLSTSTGHNAHHPSVTATIVSDDGGATWTAGEIVAGQGDGVVDPSEMAVAEPEPGRVVLSIRNESPGNRRALAWSPDGANDWSAPEFNDALWEPVCMAGLVMLPDGGLVFSNPVSITPYPNRPHVINRVRQNLGLRVSRDQGGNWSEALVIEPGLSAYSDVAVAPDGAVLCFFEHGVESPYDAMSVVRVPASQLPDPRP